MAVLNLNDPIFHRDDPTTGGPLVGGKVYTYIAGTTTPVTTYQDSSLVAANTNPVVLDANGDAKIWFNTDIKIVVKSADETETYYTFDNISPVGGTTTVTGNYNAVLNGSFESDANNIPDSWTVAPYSGASITVDTTNVTHGQQACKFDGVTGIGGGVITSAKFDVKANSTVAVYFDYMVSNATTTNSVQLFWYQKDGTASATVSTDVLNAASGHPTSMEHREYMVTAPSDATQAELKITGIASGGSNLDADAWFDNIFVVTEQAVLHNLPASSAVANYIAVTGVGTGGTPAISSEGEADIGLWVNDSNGNRVFSTSPIANAVNYVVLANNSSGNKPIINQGGADDVGVEIEGVELHNGTLTSNGDITLTTGDVVPSAGNGIDFSANTGAAGMTSELLDWYEEGTWTPTLQDTSFSNGEGQTYGVQDAVYTRIGRVVFVEGLILMTSLGTLTAGSAAYLAGLPFTARSHTNDLAGLQFHVGSALNIAQYSSVVGTVINNSTHVLMQLWDATGGTSNMLISEVTASGALKFSGHYFV